MTPPTDKLSLIREPTLPDNPTAEQVEQMIGYLLHVGVLESTALIRGLRTLHDVLGEFDELPNAELLASVLHEAWSAEVVNFLAALDFRQPATFSYTDPVYKRFLISVCRRTLDKLKFSRDYRRFFGGMTERDVAAARDRLVKQGWRPPVVLPGFDPASPPACRVAEGAEPAAILFALYNQGGAKPGIAWDGGHVPAWDALTEDVRNKWRHVANHVHFDSECDDHSDNPMVAEVLAAAGDNNHE